MSGRQHKRKLSNYLLQPLIQVKLGLYSIILSIAFGLVMTWLFYINFYRLYDMILELTDLKEEISLMLSSHIQDSIAWMAIGMILYFLLVTLTSVFYTHRLVGPTYAFRRHIQELAKGNYQSRVNLRKNDAFAEVAEDLNQLADALQTRAQRESRP